MIDLHTHILPQVDDGAEDLEMALAMGRYGLEQGLTKIAATPHFYQIPDWELIKKKVAELQKEFDAAQISLEIIPGAELFIDLDIMDMAAHQIPTYANMGKFCLIELPLQQIPIYTEQVIFSLQTKGITPIIAHPERYAPVVADPNVLLPWIRQGCLIQVNAGSILGRFGSKIRETAEIMLTHQMVHLVGSDGHRLERRQLNLAACLPDLTAIAGQELAQQLVTTNPGAILAGTFQAVKEPIEYRKRRRFLFF